MVDVSITVTTLHQEVNNKNEKNINALSTKQKNKTSFSFSSLEKRNPVSHSMCENYGALLTARERFMLLLPPLSQSTFRFVPRLIATSVSRIVECCVA